MEASISGIRGSYGYSYGIENGKNIKEAGVGALASFLIAVAF